MDSEPLTPPVSLYREHGRYALIAGYVAIWLMMTLLSVAALGYMTSIQGQLRNIVSNHYSKKELVKRMHINTRERVFGMQHMLLLDDPFERDDEYLKIQQYGLEYTQARDQFLKLPLEPAEQELMKQHNQLARQAGPAQRSAIDLIMNNEFEPSRQILIDDVIPLQQQAMTLLKELEEYQDTSIKQAFQRTEDAYDNATKLLVFLGAIAVFLLLAIAIKVFNVMRHAAQAVHDEKDRLRITLHSIGDGVIATDNLGAIEYINPVAEQYTGWSRDTAEGMAIFDVFNVINAADGLPVAASVDELSAGSPNNDDLHHHSLLRRFDDSTLAVDYTASAIHHHDGTIGGYVIVFRDESKLREMAHHLTHQATHDPLTNLPNRRAFEQRLELLLKQAGMHSSGHVLCYLDLDRFKIVNDTCGHAAGDDLLKQVVDLFRQRVRSNDLLARIGGDEFGLLLENCPIERALGITEEIRKTIHLHRFVWNGQSFHIGVSIGMVAIDNRWKSLPELLAAADAACYAAKDGGRNRVHLYFTGNTGTGENTTDSWSARFRIALEQDRLIHYYQKPIPLRASTESTYIDLQLRIMEQGRQRLPLTPLLPHAERHGLAPQFDRWAVQNALMLAMLCENSNAIYTIHLSAASLQDGCFISDISTMAANHLVQPQQLCLEIPESYLLTNAQQASDVAHALKSSGFRVALNGTGRNIGTLDVLRSIPFDYLRIPGDYIHEAMEDPILLIQFEATVRMAQGIGMQVIAMDIQSHQLLEPLERIGVDMIGGHGIAKQQPAIALLVNDNLDNSDNWLEPKSA